MMDESALRSKVKIAALEYWRAVSESVGRKGYIPPSGKVLGEGELLNMIDATLDMWLTAGRFNEKFEAEFAKKLGVKHALTANSGSSANLLAVSALTSPRLGSRALKRGDEVITVAAGFPTTVNPIVQNGLVPVFVDCEIDTSNADMSKLEEALSPRTKAVFLAHTLGNPYDSSKLAEFCRARGMWLIEDSCDALGAKFGGRLAGTVGDIGTFSFYPAHHITMGEGGAVVTDNPLLRKIILSFRDWGRDCWCAPGRDGTCGRRFSFKLGGLPEGYDHKYTYSHIGYNLKITDWQAAIGLAQLERLDEFVRLRTRNAAILSERLADLSQWLILPKPAEGAQPSWFGYLMSVRPEAGFGKRELVEHLESRGIGTRQLFAGNILRQPMFADADIPIRIGSGELKSSRGLSEGDFALLPNTEFIMKSSFWVGCYPGLDECDMEKIADEIRKFVLSRKP